MSVEQNKAIVRRFFDEVLNQKDFGTVDELCAENYVLNVPPNPMIRGQEGLKQFLNTLFTALPDIHYTVEDMVAEGDKVAVRWTCCGTHKGEYMNIAPTLKEITVTGIHILRIASGKMEEDWANVDFLGMMQQLGVIPPPGQGKE